MPHLQLMRKSVNKLFLLLSIILYIGYFFLFSCVVPQFAFYLSVCRLEIIGPLNNCTILILCSLVADFMLRLSVLHRIAGLRDAKNAL